MNEVLPSITSRQILFVCLLLGSMAGLSQKMLVTPYVQPGNAPKLSREQKVLIWETDNVPATFTVEYAEGSFESARKIASAKVTSVPIKVATETTLLYKASLNGLKFDETYAYRVKQGNEVVQSATFETRTKKDQTRFAVFGDCGTASPEQKAIGYQVAQQKPQFVLIPGDLVYNRGLVLEYRARFFSIYNGANTSLEEGASLMKSIPFYPVLGNHDVLAWNLDKMPGGLAYFYYFDLPQNAPITKSKLEVVGSPEVVKAFKAAADGYPRAANYSFDDGNVHITCLDANGYVNPLDPELLEWMREDITSSPADWKLVTFHEPGFNSSHSHDEFQLMRLLSPFMESWGVDMVLCGHVHNYQRTMPLKFAPQMNEKGDQYVITPSGRVSGSFTLDKKFDGVNNTRPEGIIYIVTGGGGAVLYDTEISDKPELWKKEDDPNWEPYTVKLISNVHTFSMIETEGKNLTLRQINLRGEVVDHIKVTK